MDKEKEYEESSETAKERKAARKMASRRDRSKYKKTNIEIQTSIFRPKDILQLNIHTKSTIITIN
jgi:hypothetical protein